jgi:hypothetical protein
MPVELSSPATPDALSISIASTVDPAFPKNVGAPALLAAINANTHTPIIVVRERAVRHDADITQRNSERTNSRSQQKGTRDAGNTDGGSK